MKQDHFRRILAAVSIIISILLTSPNLGAYSRPAPEYQVKAAFLYNFTHFVTWPPDAFRSPAAPFIIGIIGDDPFGPYMEQLVKGEQVDTHPIIVRRYKHLADVVDCHLLFVNTPAARHREIIKLIGRRSILTVADGDTFTDAGGTVGFFKENNKIRLQVNMASSKMARLEISSKLLSVARLSGEY